MALLKIKIKKPRITLGDKDRAAALGFVVGGPAGAAAGYMYGDKLGKWSQNQWNNLTGKNARVAQEEAGKEAERVRRENIVKEFGAKQQYDSLAYAGAMNSGNASSNAPGLVGQSAAPGTIGANISSSGTF